MNDFMIFVAPFITVIISIGLAFYVAPKDGKSKSD
ncbi:cytochrome bd oxidase small subunit CydS [Lysinibacillus telephonicus]